MTVEEARMIYGDPQNHGYVWCTDCPCVREDGTCPSENQCNGEQDAWERIAKYMSEQEATQEESTETVEPTDDPIKHPNHYCREGAMECIDEMVMIFGVEAVKHFCVLNMWKYRYRSNSKNGEEDIKKSDQYARIYKELCDGK